jgi:hypothetical protein
VPQLIRFECANPWSELIDEIAEILAEDALDRAADKGIRLDRAQLQLQLLNLTDGLRRA